YATALGSAELAQNSVQGRMLEVEQATVDMAGNARLEQIRASLGGGGGAGQLDAGAQHQLGASGAPRQVTSGNPVGQEQAAQHTQQQPNQG
ncbi:MAG TPA: PspA/IM30 family protein, partial [Pseudonocardia sp.]|nr:PspA/IM30 family protein [Pseudonocardia sp.]